MDGGVDVLILGADVGADDIVCGICLRWYGVADDGIVVGGICQLEAI